MVRAHWSVASILRRLAANRIVFHYARLPAYWGTLPRLAAALDLQPGERLLDIGCGTGIGAALTRGPYVGIDTDVSCLRFARRRLPRATCSLVAMSALDLGFRDGQVFDKAVLINMVHHLPDAVLDRLLEQVARIVRQRVVVLDVDRDIANPVSRFLLDHDRGQHVRDRQMLAAHLARHFEVAAAEAFHNALHIVPQILFVLRPR